MRSYCTLSLGSEGPIGDPFEDDRKRLELALAQKPIYSSRVKGTSLFEVSATGWTKREAEARLEQAISEVQPQIPPKILWVDTGLSPLIHWPRFVAMLSLMLFAFPVRLFRRA